MNENNSSYGLLKKYTTAKLLNTCSKLKKKENAKFGTRICSVFYLKLKLKKSWNGMWDIESDTESSNNFTNKKFYEIN